MMNSLEEAIKHCEEVAEELEEEAIKGCCDDTEIMNNCIECAKEHRQLAEWLRELQRIRFEISECKAILDNPTPDVTENDKKRAMYVLQTFPDVKADEEGR